MTATTRITPEPDSQPGDINRQGQFTDGPSHHRRSLAGAVTGSTLEVFDFTIYNTFAPFFAASLFAAGNATTAFLQSLIVLAVGFIARPLGSLFFGHLSDTRGRRISLYATSATALTGTLLIAISPGHNLLGIGAAIVLIVARVLQGFAHGGEQPAAGAYVSEVAKPSNRGRWSSVVYMSILGGGVLGSLLGAVLSSWLGVPTLKAWAWRLPFFVGAIGSISALVMIHRMPETRVFTREKEKVRAQHSGPGLAAQMWAARRSALQIIGLTLGLTIAFQNWAAIGSYHIAILKANASHVLWIAVAVQLVAIPVVGLWGRISDRIGRKPVVLIGFIGLAVTTYPFMRFLDGSAARMALTMGVSYFFLAAPLSVTPALMAELVPTRIRTLGVGFPYALATAIFGGTVPMLQSWTYTAFSHTAFGIYVTAALVVSIVVTLTIPETLGLDLGDDEAVERLNRITPSATGAGAPVAGGPRTLD
ncbi:Alpha-ketoglutarate transporter, MFS super [Propionibacterium freudenreichii]|uniref:MFS transporter n=1 Tax=Propionibacterium freudenreichii TaxID=1744 RepID=UPI000BC310C8|nr:MFS transporter [Propionibacterium freudenreichii]SBN59932.1 Alpha-ketoglutarate transporter, MFS super [Propionibacterium freudenreichii]SCQ48372.1 Alpha-ketoglutarate transporter, MFS super [Propionibacterium freudenreichii]SCQ53144.1 Alpha-ketoglutarate transporter, MFS super [Propionibacterium freudenreichii]